MTKQKTVAIKQIKRAKARDTQGKSKIKGRSMETNGRIRIRGKKKYNKAQRKENLDIKKGTVVPKREKQKEE